VSDPQAILSDLALTTFRLNGQVLALAEDLARPVGLTAARWQVLGAVLTQPLPVSAIAREMGMARQSVQRIADILVDAGLADYSENPSHRRAKLLAPTQAGLEAVHRINPAHAEAAAALVAVLGADRATEVVQALHDLSRALTQTMTAY
jgi:DNA-binding MarR family transcriptional regulator